MKKKEDHDGDLNSPAQGSGDAAVHVTVPEHLLEPRYWQIGYDVYRVETDGSMNCVTDEPWCVIYAPTCEDAIHMAGLHLADMLRKHYTGAIALGTVTTDSIYRIDEIYAAAMPVGLAIIDIMGAYLMDDDYSPSQDELTLQDGLWIRR